MFSELDILFSLEKLNLESRKRKKMKVAGKKKGFAPSFPINAEDSETAGVYSYYLCKGFRAW